MSSRIPPLLEPYLSLPSEASLILLTSVLGASSNWLVLRFLHSALLASDVVPEDEPKVLLVSFMRDATFWKENARRLGLDLDKFAAKKRFAFVDGLSALFLSQQGKPPMTGEGGSVLTNPSLAIISEEIPSAVRRMKDSHEGSKVLLVIDQLDLLLAAGYGVSPVNLGDMLIGLREEVHATIVTLSADYPLVSGHQTPLETDHAAFLLSVAHDANFSMGVRLLDSGTARDVSGVVRITVGDATGDQGSAQKIEDKELLYFVGGDGNVRVFERGQ